MDRPIRKKALPAKLSRGIQQNLERADSVNSNVPTLEHMEDNVARQRQNLERKKINTNKTEKSDVMYRMLRRTIGTLSAKVNEIAEEVRNSKQAAVNERRLSEHNEGITSDVTRINKEITENEIVVSRPSENVSGHGNSTQNLTEKDKRNIIYNIQNINVEKPKFGDGKEIHPVTFLEDLDAYIKKTTPNDRVLDAVLECLVGNARDWARIYKTRWSGLEDFKTDFLTTYWGEKEQNEIRRTIVQGSWNQEEASSMLDYFLALVGKAQMLTYKLPERQIITDLIRHFPKNIQQGWVTSKINSIIETADFLRSMDDINKSDRRAFPSTSRTYTANRPGGKRQTEQLGNFQSWKKPRVNFIKAVNQQPETVAEEEKEIALN